MELSKEAHNNRNAIEAIRCRLHQGAMTYEQARTEAKPIIARMNLRGAEIAREHGFRYKPLTFAYLIR